MIFLISFSFRNMWRNVRRTSFAVAILAMSVAMLILYGSFNQGVYRAFRDSLIRSYTGHLQIFAKGFRSLADDSALSPLIPYATYQALSAWAKQYSEIEAVSPRIEFVGLASAGERTTNFLARGVLVAKEPALDRLGEVVEGRSLQPADRDQVLIGSQLAAKLKVRVGDQVTLFTSTVYGSVNAVLGEVVGIFSTGNKIVDANGVLLPLALAQTVLDSQDVQKISLLLRETNSLATITPFLEQHLHRSPIPLEMATWFQLAEDYPKIVAMYDGIFHFIFWVLTLVCLLSVVQVFLVNVFERTREIGTLMALGRTPRQILSLFITEGVCVGVVGALFGSVLGLLLVSLLSIKGISMPPPPGSSKGYLVYLTIQPMLMAKASGVSLLAASFASWIAAYRGAKLNIVEALRHV